MNILQRTVKYPSKYLSMLSWQFGVWSASNSSFTPESCSLLSLRSRSLRREFDDCRAEATIPQHWSVRLQPDNLNTVKIKNYKNSI